MVGYIPRTALSDHRGIETDLQSEHDKLGRPSTSDSDCCPIAENPLNQGHQRGTPAFQDTTQYGKQMGGDARGYQQAWCKQPEKGATNENWVTETLPERLISRLRYTIVKEVCLVAYRLIAQGCIAYRSIYRDSANMAFNR